MWPTAATKLDRLKCWDMILADRELWGLIHKDPKVGRE